MTIIEWDVPIARQLARENVGALRASEDGWAQALADAAVSLTQVERDVLLMDAASNRHPTEKRTGDDEVPARSHEQESAQAGIRALMRLRDAQLAQASETVRAWEVERALPAAETSEPERAWPFENASTLEHAFDAEEESTFMHEWVAARELELERASQSDDGAARMDALELQHASELERALEVERASALLHVLALESPLMSARNESMVASSHHAPRPAHVLEAGIARPHISEQIHSRDPHDAMREAEECLRRQADAALIARMPSETRLAGHEAEQTRTHPAAGSSARHVHVSEAESSRHAAPAVRRGEHAPHHMRSLHVAQIVYAAHSSQAARLMAPGDVEATSRTAGDDDAPFALGVGKNASTGATAAPAHKRAETINSTLAWFEGPQPVRTPRGAIATGGTARSLLASMRRVSSDDNASLRGLALPRGTRAGGPLLRRVTHAYLGRDGVTLWVRDAKMSAQHAAALLSALHRWATLAGIKVAAVICNGKMIYRAARENHADLTTREMEKKEKNT